MSTGDHGETPYELTRNPVDETWGFVCREHALLRSGLTHQHAINVERQHVRQHHADPLDIEVDLSAAARMFLACQDDATRDLWASLFGMEGEDAEDHGEAYALAVRLVQAETPVRAAVVPL